MELMTTAQLRDTTVSIVTDFCDPALDNLAVSLDHLTLCFCDSDKQLAADGDVGGTPLAA